jgi:hypothetical protein
MRRGPQLIYGNWSGDKQQSVGRETRTRPSSTHGHAQLDLIPREAKAHGCFTLDLGFTDFGLNL